MFQDGTDNNGILPEHTSIINQLRCNFTRIPTKASQILSQYLSAIGIRLYLAFDDRYHHSLCITKQTYSLPVPANQITGLKPSQTSNQILCQATAHTTAINHALPHGLLAFHSPLLCKSSLVYSPPLNDMLKSRGYTFATANNSDTATAYRINLRPSSLANPIEIGRAHV